MLTYKLVWNDFCAWYLEMIKPGFEQPIDGATYRETVAIFSDLLKVLHPFTPFISEELWDQLGARTEAERLIVAHWPAGGTSDTALIEAFEVARQLIMEVRRVRNEKGLGNKEPLALNFKGEHLSAFDGIVTKLANLSEIVAVSAAPASSAGFVAKGTEYFIPLAGQIDAAEEAARINKELEYTKGFLISVDKKLSNERFVSGAPAQVLENERSKKADAEAKIKALEQQLASF